MSSRDYGSDTAAARTSAYRRAARQPCTRNGAAYCETAALTRAAVPSTNRDSSHTEVVGAPSDPEYHRMLRLLRGTNTLAAGQGSRRPRRPPDEATDQSPKLGAAPRITAFPPPRGGKARYSTGDVGRGHGSRSGRADAAFV